jgi:hypothetical protein
VQKTPGSAVIVTLELSHDAIPSVAVITFWISSGKSSVHAFTNLQITCAEAALGTLQLYVERGCNFPIQPKA